jgi:cob(I)alamin adenosyltransferase
MLQLLYSFCFWLLLQNTGKAFLETDGDILETISSSFRDDGSTALAAVLIGKCLYVANVGDSRAVASKAGKGKVAARKKRPKRTASTSYISKLISILSLFSLCFLNWMF